MRDANGETIPANSPVRLIAGHPRNRVGRFVGELYPGQGIVVFACGAERAVRPSDITHAPGCPIETINGAMRVYETRSADEFFNPPQGDRP